MLVRLFQPFRVFPQPFQVIVRTSLDRKYMDNKIYVIDNHPATGCGARFPETGVPLPLESNIHNFGQSLDVRCTVTRANEEVVGNTREGANIEHDNMVGLLVIQNVFRPKGQVTSVYDRSPYVVYRPCS